MTARHARSVTHSLSSKLNPWAHKLKNAPLPDKIIFNAKKRPGFYEEGAASRLPEAYFKYNRPFAKPPALHWKDPGYNFYRDPVTGERVQTERTSILIEFPEESLYGLWGGEGIINGFKIARRKKRFSPSVPALWKPYVKTQTVHSEILSRSWELGVTVRVMDLIDEAYGFDFYILKTPAEELNSLAGMILKRHILMALAMPENLYPDEPQKRQKILHKYRHFIIPYAEAEWVGLTPGEAIQKQRALEKAANPDIPLEEIYTNELINRLTDERGGVFEMQHEKKESKPFLSRIFGGKSTKDVGTPV